MAKSWGETLARAVDLRIGDAVATTAALTALPVEERVNDQLRMVTADSSLWRISTSATTAVSATVLAFDSGDGRAIRVSVALPTEVRGVAATNVADLTAFVVAGFDGVTYAAGDLVLLANQTTPSQNGVYIVGTVDTTAPLTRAPGMAAGTVVKGGYTVHASEGTLFKHSSWFIGTTGSITIGTTSHAWYPESVTQTIALVAGTTTISNVPIFSATKTGFSPIRSTANTCVATDGGYVLNGNPTPGVVGTASAVIMASVLAGTINNADVSTLHITITNR